MIVIQESELVNYLAAGCTWNFKTRSNAGLYLFTVYIIICTLGMYLPTLFCYGFMDLVVSAFFVRYWDGVGLMSYYSF